MKETTSEQKLRELVKDLNFISQDLIRFPTKPYGLFELKFDKREIHSEQTSIAIALYYKEKDLRHCIFLKTLIQSTAVFNEEEFWKKAYYEILVFSYCAFDSINKLKEESTGLPINILSFQTMISEGLKKLREKT